MSKYKAQLITINSQDWAFDGKTGTRLRSSRPA
jgi:hypothetical protein